MIQIFFPSKSQHATRLTVEGDYEGDYVNSAALGVQALMTCYHAGKKPSGKKNSKVGTPHDSL